MEDHVIGEVAKSIPEESWKQLVDAACSTFKDLVAPITQTTAGLGRLIAAKFDSMEDVQRVYAADILRQANQRVEGRLTIEGVTPKANVVLPILEYGSNEPDDSIRSVWANLLAREMLNGKVHPEFPRLLSRISVADALALDYYARGCPKYERKEIESEQEANSSDSFFSAFGNFIKKAFEPTYVYEELSYAPSQFDIENLARLGLLKKKMIFSYSPDLFSNTSGEATEKNSPYEISELGTEFLKGVSGSED